MVSQSAKRFSHYFSLSLRFTAQAFCALAQSMVAASCMDPGFPRRCTV